MLRLKAENESLQTSVKSLEEKCALLTSRNGNDHKSPEVVAHPGSGDDSSKQQQQHELQQQQQLQQQRPVEAQLDSKVNELEENLRRELELSRLACVTAETGLRQSASERSQERDGFTQVNQ
jgi:hypothetical protein